MTTFYLDADVSVHVAPLLQLSGYGAITATSMGLQTASDDAQIETAVLHGWILITHNRKHFRLLHDAWHRFARMWQVMATHPGILIARQGPAEQTSSDVLSFLQLGLLLRNELYEWTPSRGWSRRP
ncbi:MAG: DUF5615 family PIN-like protein [Chloroflexi bacterium]|nr:DUF5615 family PIN-like protein [Chloroflexota bacterium]